LAWWIKLKVAGAVGGQMHLEFELWGSSGGNSKDTICMLLIKIAHLLYPRSSYGIRLGLSGCYVGEGKNYLKLCV